MDEGPLQPVYNPQRAPWQGYFTRGKKEQSGRVNWWAELGYQDPWTPQKKICIHQYAIREKDPAWFDPPVEDGTSVAGFRGLDTRYHASEERKFDRTGDLMDYKDYLVKNSTQYKNLVEKFKLSPEHPGLAVSPALTRLEYTPYKNLGVGGFLPQSLHQWGPRFFNKPMNEGCAEKGLALVKLSAFYTLISTAGDYKIARTPGPKTFNYKDFALMYVKNFPFPAALGFGYGVSICTSATIRNRDDIYNYYYSGIFTGVLAATLKDNIPLGFTIAVVLSTLGTVFHYMRISRNGLSGPQYNPMFSSPFWYGPLLYRGLDFGSAKIPEGGTY